MVGASAAANVSFQFSSFILLSVVWGWREERCSRALCTKQLLPALGDTPGAPRLSGRYNPFSKSWVSPGASVQLGLLGSHLKGLVQGPSILDA